jgi:crossover junction endodeoxyribonuclease RusA
MDGDHVLRVSIPGTPRPQGSLKIITARNGRAFAKNSETTVEHRNLVVYALSQEWQEEPLNGPVAASFVFRFARPTSHYGTGRNEGRLLPSAPQLHARTPDTDKVTRLLCDALTIAGVIKDDSLITALRAEKQWTEGRAETVIDLWRL